MKDIYDISSSPTQAKLKEQLLSKLQALNKQGSIYDAFIGNYQRLYGKYMQMCSLVEQIELNKNSIRVSNDIMISMDDYDGHDDISRSITLLKDQLNKTELNNNETTTLLNKALIDMVEMRNQIDRLEKENGRLFPLNELLKSKCTSLEKRVADLDDITKEKEKELLIHKQRYTKMENDNKMLKKQLDDAMKENRILINKIHSVQDDMVNKINTFNDMSEEARKKKEAAEIYFNDKAKEFNVTHCCGIDDDSKESLKKTIIVEEYLSSEFKGQEKEVKIPTVLQMRNKIHGKGITSLQFNTFGTQYISSSMDMLIKKWDGNKNSELGLFTGFTSTVTSVAFDNTEQMIFAAGLDKTARLWSLTNNKLLSKFGGHMDYIHALRTFYSCSKGITGSSDLTIKHWDFKSQKQIKTYNCASGCYSLAISHDDAYFISGHIDGSIKVWSPLSDKPDNQLKLHDDKVLHIEMLKNESQFLSISQDFTIKLFDVRKMETVYTLNDGTIPQFCESNISVSSDKKYFAVGSGKGNVFICNTTNGSLIETLDNKSDGSILVVQWRPHHSQLYVGDSLGSLFIWGMNQ